MFHEHPDWLKIELLVDALNIGEGELMALARSIHHDTFDCLFELSSDERRELLRHLEMISELEAPEAA